MYQCLDSLSLSAVCHHCQTVKQQHEFLLFVSLACCFSSEGCDSLNSMFANVSLLVFTYPNIHQSCKAPGFVCLTDGLAAPCHYRPSGCALGSALACDLVHWFGP